MIDIKIKNIPRTIWKRGLVTFYCSVPIEQYYLPKFFINDNEWNPCWTIVNNVLHIRFGNILQLNLNKSKFVMQNDVKLVLYKIDKDK